MTQRPKDILLCFDAFGTLFKPRSPIWTQYGEVARKYGVGSFTDEQLKSSFKDAFKRQLKDHPNYGKATGMGTERWWTEIVQQTFHPFLPKDRASLPPALAPALIQRFRGKEGYTMYQDALDLLKSFNEKNSQATLRRGDRCVDGTAERRLVIGVVSNFDDRLMDILPSLQIKLKPLRHGADVTEFHPTDSQVDLDFAIISYDVGIEKPGKAIFDSALSMLKSMLSAEGAEDPDLSTWRTNYVVDEPDKDVFGAVDAGWEAILVDRPDDSGMLYLGDKEDRRLDQLVADNRVAIVQDLGEIRRFLD